MKQTRTTLKELTARYRAVLLKCALMNMAFFSGMPAVQAETLSDGTNTYIGSFGVPLKIYDNVSGVGTFYAVSENVMANASVSGVTATLENASLVGAGNLFWTSSTGKYAEVSSLLTSSQIESSVNNIVTVLTAKNTDDRNYDTLPGEIKEALNISYAGYSSAAAYLEATWGAGNAADIGLISQALYYPVSESGAYAEFNYYMNTLTEWKASVSITGSTLTLNGTSAIVNRTKAYGVETGNVSISGSTIIANGENKIETYTGTYGNISLTNSSLLQVNQGATLTIQSSGNIVSLTDSNLTLNGTITGNVSFGGSGDLTGTGSISGNLDVADSSVLNMKNNAIDAIFAGTVTGGNFSVALDVDAVNSKIDSLTASSFATGTRTITIADLHFLSEERNFTLTVLNGDVTGVTLELSSAVHDAYNSGGITVEWRNNLTPTANWKTAFTKTKYTIDTSRTLTVQDNKKLVFTVTNGAETQGETVSLGDTLALLNTMDSATRTFINSNSAASYTVKEDLGTTAAGTFTINGVSSAATINMNGHTGFSVASGATLNLQNIVFSGNTVADGPVLTVSGGAAELSNVTIGNAVSVTSGTLTLSGGNSLGGLANAGTVTLTGNNAVGAMSGAGTLTNNGNLTLTGTTNGQIIGGTGRTIVNAALTTTAAINQAITINGNKTLTADADLIGGAVTNSGVLALTDGKLEQTVSGGAVHINGNVESSVALSNVTISLGNKLTIGAENIGTGLTNNGSLVLTGETLSKAVSGTGGRTYINADLTTAAAINQAITINGGKTLTADADLIGGAVTNDGTLSLTGGRLEKNVTGGTVQIAGDVISDVDLANVTINANNKLTINADYVDNTFSNNGTLALSGGTLTATVSLGTVHIDGDVTSNVSLSNTTINLDKQLTIGASNVGTEFTNNGLAVLKDGTLGNTVSGAGAVQIDGDVTSNVVLSKATINSGKTLTISADNIGANLANNGSLVLTGGTLVNAVSGAIQIDGTVSSSVSLSNTTINLGKQLTIGASNIGANLTNNGTVSVTGGTLSNALSGSVSVAGTVLFGAGADLSGAQIDLTNGTLDIGENVLSVNTVTGGTVSLTLKETAESSALITAASANNVTVAPDMSRVSRKAVQHYILTSTDTGYSLILNNTGRYAVSKTPFEKSQASSMTHFDVSSWTGGDLYVMRISSVALIAYQDLIEAGYSLTPNETNAVSVMADDVTELLPAGYQGAVDIVNGRLETAVAERNYAQMLQAFREVGEEASPAVVQTAQSNAEAVMSVVANRLNGSAAAVSGTGRSGGDYTVGASSVWAQGMLNAAELNGTNGFKSDTAGFAAGFEYNINDSYKAGIGYAFSSTDIKTGRSKTSVDTHTGFVYGEYAPDAFFVNGVLSYGRSAYDEKTKMLGLKSDFKTDAFAVQMMSGYVLKDFTPEAGLRYINVREKAYTNALGARTAGKNLQTWTAVAGVKTAKEFRLEKGMLTAHGKAALTYDLRRGNPDRTVVLANGSSYVAQEEKMKRFGLEAGAGISYRLDGKTELSVSYEGRFKKHYVDHTGILSIKYAF